MKLRLFSRIALLIVGCSSSLLAQCATKDSDCTVSKPQPVRVLTSDARYRDAWPTMSPDGQQIVFARRMVESDARWKLCVVPFAGGEPQPLTPEDFPYDAITPSWSPDGAVIAFKASRGKDEPGIWFMTAVGDNLRRLTDGKRFDEYYPAWSHDGKWFTLSRAVIGEWNYDIWQVSLDGTERRITTHEEWDGRSTVSPDGRNVAFASGRDGILNIWILIMEEGEKSARQFTFNQGRAPAWSPDGKWIAFGSNRGGSYAIYLKPVSGGCAIQVTEGKANEFHPVWSPDGNWLVVDTEPDKLKSYIAVVDVKDIVRQRPGESK